MCFSWTIWAWAKAGVFSASGSDTEASNETHPWAQPCHLPFLYLLIEYIQSAMSWPPKSGSQHPGILRCTQNCAVQGSCSLGHSFHLFSLQILRSSRASISTRPTRVVRRRPFWHLVWGIWDWISQWGFSPEAKEKVDLSRAEGAVPAGWSVHTKITSQSRCSVLLCCNLSSGKIYSGVNHRITVNHGAWRCWHFHPSDQHLFRPHFKWKEKGIYYLFSVMNSAVLCDWHLTSRWFHHRDCAPVPHYRYFWVPGMEALIPEKTREKSCLQSWQTSYLLPGH